MHPSMVILSERSNRARSRNTNSPILDSDAEQRRERPVIQTSSSSLRPSFRTLRRSTFLLGNHELYHSSWKEVRQKADEFAALVKQRLSPGSARCGARAGMSKKEYAGGFSRWRSERI